MEVSGSIQAFTPKTHSEGGGVLQPGPLSDAIIAEFGSLDALKAKFNATTAAIQVLVHH